MKRNDFLVILAVAGGAPLWAAEPDPAAKPLSVSPLKEPVYQSGEPLYGRIAFDHDDRTVVWAVLDASGKGGTYDVLYFDRNADGNLTDDDERLVAEDSSFSIGEFRDPGSGAVHTAMKVRFDRKDQDVFISLNWKGKDTVMGGYAAKPGPYLHFAKKPEDAPLVRLVAEGPFSVQPWMLEPLRVGGATDVKFFLGHAGKGANSFAGLHQGFLPDGDGLKATLIYETGSGEKRELVSKLLDRC